MAEQNKHGYFKQIAGKRVERILEALDALGNCSSPVTYDYDNQELPPIFAAITEKLMETRQRLVTHSPYNGIPFRLQPPDSLELDGCKISRRQLAGMDEVMALLDTGAPTFVSLEPVRERYEAEFGSELCWTIPVFHDGHSGCVLLPVQKASCISPTLRSAARPMSSLICRVWGFSPKGRPKPCSTGSEMSTPSYSACSPIYRHLVWHRASPPMRMAMDNLDFYKEVRGVMTCFEPLTDAVLQRAAEDGLTVREIRSVLEKHGLNFQYVVHDPSRSTFNTYYADYDRGLYGEIFLQRKMLEGPLPLYKVAARLNGKTAPELVLRQWGSYYLKCVPLPMLPYDFQRRYREIPPDEVFQVWYGIYKRIDYSNGIWRSEVLDYVFSHAPAPECPALGPNGLVTIYRGMGELSAPPEQAISWSTHPGNALWFAVHSGRGTHVAVAHIRPEQIVWYADKYYNENEVIVRPGTITEYHYEDMIPATEEYVPAILAPTLLEFIQYGRQAQKLGYQEESIFGFHGLKHILRVLLLSLIYCHNAEDPLSNADKQILIYFSLLHDIGRVNDDKDDSHGEKSVALIQSRGLRIKDLQMGKKEYRIAELLIRYHCRDDNVGEKAILSAPGLTQKEKTHIIHLYHICKDMDGLDRIRFNGLDYRQLRTDYGRRLPLVAGALLKESLVKALDIQL